MCSRIAVMYLGKIVEMGETEAVSAAAQAPVYAGAAVSRASPGSDRYPPPGQNRWRGLDPAGPTTPLPFLQPLSDRGRLLPGQSAPAAGGEGGAADSGGLLSRRRTCNSLGLLSTRRPQTLRNSRPGSFTLEAFDQSRDWPATTDLSRLRLLVLRPTARINSDGSGIPNRPIPAES